MIGNCETPDVSSGGRLIRIGTVRRDASPRRP